MRTRTRVELADVFRFLQRIPNALTRRADERRHRKLMRKAPRFTLAELPESTFGKIVGVARPAGKRLLEAPVSGRLCVYYEVSIDLMTAEDNLVRILKTEQEALPFLVEDGTGRALVDPTNAFMSTGIDRVTSSTLHLAAPREQALLDRHRLATQVGFDNNIRYRESIVEADERIALFGAGVYEPDQDADGSGGMYRDTVPMRLRFTGSERFPLFISDDPRVL